MALADNRRNFHNTKFRNQNTQGQHEQVRKYKHYVHSPFTLKYNGVEVSVDENGKIVLTQEHTDGTYDEIMSSAGLINRIYMMLEATRKVVWRDEPFVGDEPEEAPANESTKT